MSDEELVGIDKITEAASAALNAVTEAGGGDEGIVKWAEDNGINPDDLRHLTRSCGSMMADEGRKEGEPLEETTGSAFGTGIIVGFQLRKEIEND